MEKTTRLPIRRFDGNRFFETLDSVVAEEPLELVVAFGEAEKRQRLPLAVTMRTPGNDRELALGFLFSEGLIGSAGDVLAIKILAENSLLIELRADLPFDAVRLTRHFYTSSSCGICGKASLDLVETTASFFPKKGEPRISAGILNELPGRLAAAQPVFEATGGLHAVAIFDENGQLSLIREDVGRHNAFDKLLGAALESGLLPLRNRGILVSGRAGFELVQKAAMAGVGLLAAVGAPSSLSIQLAENQGITLVGFLRKGRFNIYSNPERISD